MAGPACLSIFYLFPNVPGYISHPLHRPIDIHRYSCQETNPAQMALLKIAFCWPRLSAILQIDDNSKFQMNEQIRAAFSVHLSESMMLHGRKENTASH